MHTILDQIDQQHTQAIRTIVDGMAATGAIEDALGGGVNVKAFVGALGCTGAISALQAQLNVASAITSALMPPNLPAFAIPEFRGAITRLSK